MRCFFMPKSDWVKRLAMIWALVLGQSMAFGQTLGKSKENTLKPEAVAQLREHYKKNIGAGIGAEGISENDVKKLSIFGALTLYLDFINLFLMLLRLFGSKRD